MLDVLFPFDGALGPVFSGSSASLRLWAPTASRVLARVFDNDNTTAYTSVPLTFDTATGVWSASNSAAAWNNKFYQYEITVWVAESGAFVTNIITDPFSVSLGT